MIEYRYKGNVTPSSAWDVLRKEVNSFLIDVRNAKEWRQDGIPDISSIGKEALLFNWERNSENQANLIKFISSSAANLDSHIFFICRSGVRSKEAAIISYSAGYDKSFNVYPGFCSNTLSGDHILNNWKSENLPWRYNHYA